MAQTRTLERIQEKIAEVKALRNKLPEFSFFGDKNWEMYDLALDILDGTKTADDVEDDYELENISQNSYDYAQEVLDWMDGEDNDFDEIQE